MRVKCIRPVEQERYGNAADDVRGDKWRWIGFGVEGCELCAHLAGQCMHHCVDKLSELDRFEIGDVGYFMNKFPYNVSPVYLVFIYVECVRPIGYVGVLDVFFEHMVPCD